MPVWTNADKELLAANINKLDYSQLAALLNRSHCSTVKQARKLRKQMRQSHTGLDEFCDAVELSPEVKDNIVVARLGWFSVDEDWSFCAAEALCLETLRTILGGLTQGALVTAIQLRAVGLEFESPTISEESLVCLISGLRLEKLLTLSEGRYFLREDLRDSHRSLLGKKKEVDTMDCGKLFRTPHGIDMAIFESAEY